MKIQDIITENQAGVRESRLNEFAPGGSEGNGPFEYGTAIIQIGEDFVDTYSDEGAGADAAAIIKVGRKFMSAGMKAGIRAFYAMDTQLRDHVAEELEDQGFNVRKDIYEPHDKSLPATTWTRPAQPSDKDWYLMQDLIKEFSKARQGSVDPKTLEQLRSDFQLSLQLGFEELPKTSIRADFTDFAKSKGVDLTAMAKKYPPWRPANRDIKDQGITEASGDIRDKLAQMRSNTQDRLSTMRSNTQDRLSTMKSNTQDRLSTMRSGTSATAPSKPAPAAGPRSPGVGDTIEFGKVMSPIKRRGMITKVKGPIVTVKTDKGEEEIHLQNKSLSYSIIQPVGESQLTEVDNSTWLRTLRRLESGAKPQSDIELALQLKLDGETGIGDRFDGQTGRPIGNRDRFVDTLKRYGIDTSQAMDRADNIMRLVQAAPELGEIEQAAQQQAKDQLTHELDLKALSQQHDLSQADTQALTQMDAAARLALRQQMQEMQLEAKERLAQIEIDIRNSQEPEADRKFQLQQAQENYQHEISVLKITQEGEYKKALLEANYQIRIKELELIDNREERQNQLDKLNAEKSRELAVIDAETRAKIQVIQADVDADAQRAAADLQVEYMQAFKPIWANMLDKASQYGSTLSQQISSVVGALGRLTDVKVPRPVAEGHGPVELMRSYLDLLKEQQQQAASEAAKGIQTILALLKEFSKTVEEPEDRKTVAGIYKAFQQGMKPGFVALRNAYEFDIDADFYDFARDQGVDLDQVAAQAGFDTDSLLEVKKPVTENRRG